MPACTHSAPCVMKWSKNLAPVGAYLIWTRQHTSHGYQKKVAPMCALVHLQTYNQLTCDCTENCNAARGGMRMVCLHRRDAQVRLRAHTQPCADQESWKAHSATC